MPGFTFCNCIIFIKLHCFLSRAKHMKGYSELDIYKIAFELAVRVHIASLKLPEFEMF